MTKNSCLASSGLSLEINSPRKKSPRSSRGTKDKGQDGSGSDTQERGTVGPKKGVKLPPNTPRKASTNRALLKLRGSVHTLQVLSRLSKYKQSAYYRSYYNRITIGLLLSFAHAPYGIFKKRNKVSSSCNLITAQKIGMLNCSVRPLNVRGIMGGFILEIFHLLNYHFFYP